MSSPSSAVVVGGGVAGLCSAYYLRKRGLDVTVLESNRVGSGASWGNGGWICPAQAGPLPEPGLTWYGIRSLLDPSSALYFQRRRLPELTPWLLRFWSYCNERDHARGVEALAMLGRGVFDLVDEMVADGVEFELHRQGMLIAARDADHARQELAKLEPMRAYGYELPDDVLTGAELHALEPALAPEVDAGCGGRPALARPPRLLHRGHRRGPAADGRGGRRGRRGPRLRHRRRPSRRRPQRRRRLPRRRLLLAAGAWTNSLAAMVGVEFPMEAGKGYSFFVKPRSCPATRSCWPTSTSAAPPSGTGCGSAARWSSAASTRASTSAASPTFTTAARDCFQPWRSPEIEQPWAGMRPITPDGLPVLDSAGSLSNLFVATGYAMQGVTLAGPAGEAMAELIATGEKPELLEPFGIERLRGRRRRRRNG